MRYIPLLLIFVCQISFAQETEWKNLFNGKNLKGWEIAGEIEVAVENGEIVLKNQNSAKGGWLLSENSYDHFEVEADFFVPLPNSGGFFFRYNPLTGGHPAASGYEVKLDNQPNQQTPTGTIVGIARAIWVTSINPAGWNKLRVRAEGDYIRVWINDTQVSQIHDRRSVSGKIGLECPVGEGLSTVRWKNLRIRTLPGSAFSGPQIEDYLRRTDRSQAVSLFDGHSLKGWKVVGDARWLVVDGAIVGDTGPTGQGWLVTEKAYRNFYMRYKFKVDDGHNSGVFIRWDTAAAEVTLQNSLEINIYDPGGFMWGFPTGSIVTHSRSFAGITDSDDWNFMEIFAFGDHICLYVNGVKTTEFHIPATFDRRGFICLQAGRQVANPDQGPSQVRFKDLEIKDMSGVPFLGY